MCVCGGGGGEGGIGVHVCGVERGRCACVWSGEG